MKRILFFSLFLLFARLSIAGIVVHNGLTHIFQVKSGMVYKGEILIENTDNQPQDVKLYLRDVRYNALGETHYSIPSKDSNSNASWIKLTTNLLTLKAKEKTTVYYEIHVPEKGLRQGSYWAMLMIEPTENLKPSDRKTGVSISSVVRYAIQIITNYQSEDLKPNLKFESIKIDKFKGRRMLHVAVANTGALYFRPSVAVELYDAQTGVKAGRFTSIPMGLLPHNSKSFQIDITALKVGKYNAVLMATDRADNAFALNVVLDIK